LNAFVVLPRYDSSLSSMAYTWPFGLVGFFEYWFFWK